MASVGGVTGCFGPGLGIVSRCCSGAGPLTLGATRQLAGPAFVSWMDYALLLPAVPSPSFQSPAGDDPDTSVSWVMRPAPSHWQVLERDGSSGAAGPVASGRCQEVARWVGAGMGGFNGDQRRMSCFPCMWVPGGPTVGHEIAAWNFEVSLGAGNCAEVQKSLPF